MPILEPALFPPAAFSGSVVNRILQQVLEDERKPGHRLHRTIIACLKLEWTHCVNLYKSSYNIFGT